MNIKADLSIQTICGLFLLFHFSPSSDLPPLPQRCVHCEHRWQLGDWISDYAQPSEAHIPASMVVGICPWRWTGRYQTYRSPAMVGYFASLVASDYSAMSSGSGQILPVDIVRSGFPGVHFDVCSGGLMISMSKCSIVQQLVTDKFCSHGSLVHQLLYHTRSQHTRSQGLHFNPNKKRWNLVKLCETYINLSCFMDKPPTWCTNLHLDENSWGQVMRRWILTVLLVYGAIEWGNDRWGKLWQLGHGLVLWRLFTFLSPCWENTAGCDANSC